MYKKQKIQFLNDNNCTLANTFCRQHHIYIQPTCRLFHLVPNVDLQRNFHYHMPLSAHSAFTHLLSPNKFPSYKTSI